MFAWNDDQESASASGGEARWALTDLGTALLEWPAAGDELGVIPAGERRERSRRESGGVSGE